MFPSAKWTPRDPQNVSADWRHVRAALHLAAYPLVSVASAIVGLQLG
ncbi:hypothetical protein IUS38_23250 [Mycobacteroides abscessus subsp. abscessus]|nr:hypothetical protein [Mycobacteroides abscessus]MBN7438506.1 hypothetical protein [Mycobacteroides abscessus subsp. abscessus]